MEIINPIKLTTVALILALLFAFITKKEKWISIIQLYFILAIGDVTACAAVVTL
jgi:hypothetical protein